jgi:hypothetical protein
VKPGKHCGKHQTAIAWNQTGPQGAPGPQGLQGLQGIQGLQGLKGDTGSVDTTNFFTKSQGDARYAGSQRTYVGLDFEPIDGRSELLFASGTGGGVWLDSPPSFVEIKPELPVGATITNVRIFYRQCGGAQPFRFYYGSYDPSSGGFQFGNSSGQEVTAAEGPSCSATVSMQLPAAANFKIDPAKRFVIGAYFGYLDAASTTYDSNVLELLVGAKVDYSLP